MPVRLEQLTAEKYVRAIIMTISRAVQSRPIEPWEIFSNSSTWNLGQIIGTRSEAATLTDSSGHRTTAFSLLLVMYAASKNNIPRIAVQAMRPWTMTVDNGIRFLLVNELMSWPSSPRLIALFWSLKEWPAIL